MSKSIEQRVDQLGEAIAKNLGDIAERNNKKNDLEHPMVAVQALIHNASAMCALPLTDDNEEPVDGIAEYVLGQAEQIHKRLLKSCQEVSANERIPVIAIVLGMMEAASDLMDEFHPHIQQELDEYEATKNQVANSLTSGLDSFVGKANTPQNAQQMQGVVDEVLKNLGKIH